ncbi:MAG TPA: GNAT family N-acetyltransferase [Acidimicrobiales bacterium]|nr:GNAT family N-acetyltransferase [Acidimicrobiales bacterium]
MAGTPSELRTDRLLLRRWRDADRAPFAEMNADPEVMEHFVRPLGRDESDDMVDRIEAHFDREGWGLWAVEVLDDGRFAGFVGLWPTPPDLPFSPAVEVGWRLARHAWGRGVATEGAEAALADGWTRVGLDEVVSMTTVTNVRSQRVMQRLGMTRDPADDFEMPKIPEGHPLRDHVLYRLRRPA